MCMAVAGKNARGSDTTSAKPGADNAELLPAGRHAVELNDNNQIIF